MKNSSCGFALLKNSTTASRDLVILSLIEPETSKITPREIGASSLEKHWMGWVLSPSYTMKLSFSRPVTSRFMGSVMVTGTSTRFTSLLMGLVRVLMPGMSGGIGMAGLALSGFATGRGSTCTGASSFVGDAVPVVLGGDAAPVVGMVPCAAGPVSGADIGFMSAVAPAGFASPVFCESAAFGASALFSAVLVSCL